MDLPNFILNRASVAAPLDIASIYGSVRPLEVDVGSGKGRFLVSRATQFPETWFLGIDKRGKRIEKVNRKLGRAGLSNARLIEAEAAEVVEELIPPAAVSAYYLFFPDPWPKRRHHRRRLFSPTFMDSIHRTLLPGRPIYVATDFEDYFKGIRKLLAADPRFNEIPPLEPSDEERSDFEITFTTLGRPIYRCGFARL